MVLLPEARVVSWHARLTAVSAAGIFALAKTLRELFSYLDGLEQRTPRSSLIDELSGLKVDRRELQELFEFSDTAGI